LKAQDKKLTYQDKKLSRQEKDLEALKKHLHASGDEPSSASIIHHPVSITWTS